MVSRRISAIKPADRAHPLEVRVIRRYTPHAYKKEICYLLVDAHGDAIEAKADNDSFDSVIVIGECYTITGYVCIPARTYNNVVPHVASLAIGKRASFVPLSDVTIPTYYYNFATYDLLTTRVNNHQLLTDYIGRVESVSPILKRADKNLRKIMLQDQSTHFIEVTLWEEHAFQFIGDAAIGEIMAITSTRVTDFYGELQLESTSATDVRINPPIDNLSNIINSFKDLKGKSSTQITTTWTGNINRNRVTLAELLEKNFSENTRNRFTCLASITEFEVNRPWYYATCSQCGNKVYPEEDALVCVDDGIITDPKYMYCVNATIADNTSSTRVVLFDESMTELLGVSCNELVVKQAFTDPKILPPPILLMKAVPKIFQLQLKSNGSIVVNKVFQPQDTKEAPPPTTPLVKQMKRQLGQSSDALNRTAPKKRAKDHS